MFVPGANMTGIAKRMEKAGIILRKSDPRGVRVTMIEITPKGRKTLKSIEEEKDEWLEVLLKSFSAAERRELLAWSNDSSRTTSSLRKTIGNRARRTARRVAIKPYPLSSLSMNREKRSPTESTAQSKGTRLVFRTM
jgi:hypothetical protein